MNGDLTNDGAKAPEKKNAAPDLSNGLWNRDAMHVDSASSASLLDAKSNTSATLAHITITDNNPPRDNNPKGGADKINSSDARTPVDNKGPAEANTQLLKAANESVNQSIYKLPGWARLTKPTPDLGCVSSFSNRYREALQLAGVIDSDNDKQFRNYYQVNMDELNKVMGHDHLLEKISSKDVKEGDVIEGVTPDTSKRHMGIVGSIENGQRMVYDNYGGTWRKEPLDGRFGQYKENNYFRAFLPPKN